MKITEINIVEPVPTRTGGESGGVGGVRNCTGGESRKGLYGRYEPWEVLDGWRRQQLARGPDKVGPKSFDRPGKSDTPNVTLLMWWHVEGFFQSRDDLRRRLLLEQKDTPRFRMVEAEFEVWAKNHPFILQRTIPLPDSGGKSESEDLEVVPLAQACRDLGIKPHTVSVAIQQERGPQVWKPKGSPRLTTKAILKSWLGVAA